MNNKYSFLILILILNIIFIGSCAMVGIRVPGYCTLSSFEGRVVDVETKEPVEGAVILAVYYGSGQSIAGTHTWVVDGQETLTDENGEFKIPETKYWSKENAGRPEGSLTIFKPGYGVFPGHKDSKANCKYKSYPPPEEYIVYELPELKTREERDKNLNFSTAFGIPDKKKKLFMSLINEERMNLGYSPLTIEE